MRTTNPFVPQSPFSSARSSFSSQSSTSNRKKAQLFVEVEEDTPLNTGPSQILEISSRKGKEKMKKDHPFVRMIHTLP